MKRYGNLFGKICALSNLHKAHKNARKGKGWYAEVKMVDADIPKYIQALRESLLNHTYKTSKYQSFIKHECDKDRIIFKLPYYPDRICQWAIMQVVEPFLVKRMIRFTYSAIPNRGIHMALHDLRRAMWGDPGNCTYCLKLDIRHYYPSITHDILKQEFRRVFKDPELLWLMDEIIDSINTASPEDAAATGFPNANIGIPIGNYLSQWCGNFYLSRFDHWMKEEKRIKHYFRYMDDIVILGPDKDELHKLRREIAEYLKENLRLTVKDNWQVFPSFVRGVDFVGYRTFKNFTLLRKSSCMNLKRRMIKISRKSKIGYSDFCSINSYKGWLKYCNCYRLKQKYIEPLEPVATKFLESRKAAAAK